LSFVLNSPVGVLARAMRRRSPSPVEYFGQPSNFLPLWQMEWEKGHPNGCFETSTDSTSHVHLVHVPKAGSSSIRAIFEEDACLQQRVSVVYHGDGCLKQWRCNGSCLPPSPARSFAVLREPCSRFLSAVAYLQAVLPEVIPPLSRLISWENAVDATLELLRPAFAQNYSSCASSDGSECLIQYVNLLTSILGTYRVILYPQDFFLHPNTEVFCLRDKQVDVIGPLFDQVRAASNCPSYLNGSGSREHGERGRNPHFIKMNEMHHPEVMNSDRCEEVRSMFRVDVVAWEKHCASDR
jgi:hypothetical protein